LIAISRLVANEREAQVSEYASATGRLVRVYLAPEFPVLCSSMRLARDFAMPVYKLPSAHLTM